MISGNVPWPDRSLPINCRCGYKTDERYDNAMLTKSGEMIYRRGIRIVHRCGPEARLSEVSTPQ